MANLNFSVQQAGGTHKLQSGTSIIPAILLPLASVKLDGGTAALCQKVLRAVVRLTWYCLIEKVKGYNMGRPFYETTEQCESTVYVGQLRSSDFSGDLWTSTGNAWVGQSKFSRFPGRES